MGEVIMEAEGRFEAGAELFCCFCSLGFPRFYAPKGEESLMIFGSLFGQLR